MSARHIVEIEISCLTNKQLEEDAVSSACLPEGEARLATKKAQTIGTFLVEFDTPDEADAVARKFAAPNKSIAGCPVSAARVVLNPTPRRSDDEFVICPTNFDPNAMETAILGSRMAPESTVSEELHVPLHQQSSQNELVRQLKKLQRDVEELRTSNATLKAEMLTMVNSKQKPPSEVGSESVSKPFQRQTITMHRQIPQINNHGRRIFLTMEACVQLSGKRLPSVEMLEAIVASCQVDVTTAEQLSVTDIWQKIDRYAKSMQLLERMEMSPSELYSLVELFKKHQPPFSVVISNVRRGDELAIDIKAFNKFVIFDCQNLSFICDDSLTMFTQSLRQTWQPTMHDGDEGIAIFIFRTAYSDSLPPPDYRYFERRNLEDEQRLMRREIEALRSEIEELKRAARRQERQEESSDEESSLYSSSQQEKAGGRESSFATSSSSRSQAQADVKESTSNTKSGEAFQCVVCKCKFRIDEVFRLSTCSDQMCRTCARTFLSNEVNRKHFPLRCPICKVDIVVEDAEFVLEPKEVYDLRLAEIARETEKLGYMRPLQRPPSNDNYAAALHRPASVVQQQTGQQVWQSRPCVTCQNAVYRSSFSNRVNCYVCATGFCFQCGQIIQNSWDPHSRTCPTYGTTM